MRQTLFISLCLIGMFSLSMADLPVHCLKHHIVGDWTFAISAPTTVGDPYKFNCGHESPDDPSRSYLALNDEFHETNTFEVTLGGDDRASSKDGMTGSWTMIYDEAMDVILNEHRFTAFYSYFPDESGKVMSYCGKTVVGWYLDTTSGKKSCFRAEKKVSAAEKSDLYVEPLTQMFVVQPKDTQTSLIQQNSARMGKFLQEKENEGIKLHRQFNDHDTVAEHLNNKYTKSWTAGVHDKFKGKTIAELNQMAGRKKFPFVSNNGETTYERNTLKNSMLETQDVSDLPANFDWSDKIPRPREQKDCGSCYVFATMEMLETRLKISEHVDVTLSPQHVLDCSFQNQGCNGGYPFLVEKFANEFELVPESCSPYIGSKGHCGKCDVTSLSTVYKTKNYKFIGGAYGKSNERNMMEEIRKNGPIVVSFEPAYDFMYYTSGIYHSVDADWIVNNQHRPEWERVDHSVLAYGWGEERGEKYWLLLNSWGSDWGENGSFRMKRGVDESAIESLAEAAEVYSVHN